MSGSRVIMSNLLERLNSIETDLINAVEKIADIRAIIDPPDTTPPPKPAGTPPGYAAPYISQTAPVYWVENLNDKGEGSLRYAIELNKPIIIKTKVSGLVPLKSSLTIRTPGVKLDFSDKPFGIHNGKINIRTGDVIIGHLYAYGDTDLKNKGDAKAINITSGTNIIIHNCQVIGYTDGAIDFWNRSAEREQPHTKIQNVTIADNIIAWTLSRGGHPKGEHSRSMLISAGCDRFTISGNLYYGSTTRVPIFKDGARVEYFSNVIASTGHGPRFGQKRLQNANASQYFWQRV